MGDTGNYLDHIRKGRMGRGYWLLLGCCRFLRGRHCVRQSWCKSKKEAAMLLIRRGVVPDPNQPMSVSRDLIHNAWRLRKYLLCRSILQSRLLAGDDSDNH